jgi:hypothetical protein
MMTMALRESETLPQAHGTVAQMTDAAKTTAVTCLLIFCGKTRRNIVVTEITG